jgi:hypothetical protein
MRRQSYSFSSRFLMYENRGALSIGKGGRSSAGRHAFLVVHADRGVSLI